MNNGHNDMPRPIRAIPFIFSASWFLDNGFSTLRVREATLLGRMADGQLRFASANLADIRNRMSAPANTAKMRVTEICDEPIGPVVQPPQAHDGRP